MKTYRIHNARSGQDLGTFDGETAEHAIACLHRDAGYRAEVVDGEIVVGKGAPAWLIADPIGSLVAVEVAVEVEPESEIEIDLVIVTSDRGTVRRTAATLDEALAIRDEWSGYTTTIAINASSDGIELEELTYGRD